MDLIIQPEEVGILARPISQHIDREQLVAYITEVEQLQIRSALGGVLLSNIKQSPSTFAIILNGGSDEAGEVSGGIRKAMAYYVYARIIREGGTIATRFGAVEKNDEYATRLEQERKNTIHRECVNIADTYMTEVINYSKAQGWMTTEGINQTRRMAYVVGDGTQPKAVASGVEPIKTEADIVQGEGILINGNIVSVDFSSVASMDIVNDVEAKADEAKKVATEAQEIAERAFSGISDNTEAIVEALTKANNAEKKATATSTALTDEVNERKAEDAKVAKTIAEHDTAINDNKEKVAKNTADIATNKADISRNMGALANQQQAIDLLVEEVAIKQDELILTVLNNGNIRIGNLQGQTKDFMPATPSGSPMHYAYADIATYNDGEDMIEPTPWASYVDDADYNAKYGLNLIPSEARFVKNIRYNGEDREVWEMKRPFKNLQMWAVATYASDGTKVWDDTLYVARSKMWRKGGIGDITDTQIRTVFADGKLTLAPYTGGSRQSRITIGIDSNTNPTVEKNFLNENSNLEVLYHEGGIRPNANFLRNANSLKALVNQKGCLPLFIDNDANRTIWAEHLQYFIGSNVLSHTIKSTRVSKKTIIGLINNATSTGNITITVAQSVYNRLVEEADVVETLEAKPNITLISE